MDEGIGGVSGGAQLLLQKTHTLTLFPDSYKFSVRRELAARNGLGCSEETNLAVSPRVVDNDEVPRGVRNLLGDWVGGQGRVVL